MKSPFSSFKKKELGKLQPLVDQVLSLKGSVEHLSDDELKQKTTEFRARLVKGESLDDLLPEAFAVVREASRRVLNMEHFPVQVMGGIVLHRGRIAEMCTGEGKTLVATLPAYLNALPGEGVHVVTVNDYLAKRDCELMGPLYEFLGLSVGAILGGMKPNERREIYVRDIVYITNHELGFDYLRDNMAKSEDALVQRGLNYAIVDEVDSVLIDDARTPLIISGEGDRSTVMYQACDVLAKRMERGQDVEQLTKMDYLAGMSTPETGDFLVNEKDREVHLTEQGLERVERVFRMHNIADPDNAPVFHYMDLALRANYLMKRDKDYIVKDGKVFIVDTNTGRIMPGRRFSEGLHQAIEAKEHVQIQRENCTIATITYQTFFNKYAKLSGMTGTALTEEQEFDSTYHMGVTVIPPNKPVIRLDQDDVLFRTNDEKLNAICEDIEYCVSVGRPVLVGTSSVEASEELSERLKSLGIKHHVLNAKHHEEEAAIVAEAGKRGAVTIATNMAGRGTDIKLDDDARAAGGLLVIGAQRHDSRRIDGQLRGRSGRQGDPGESRFYLSLDDELLRLFGTKKIQQAFDAAGDAVDGIQGAAITKAIEQAQRIVEGEHFEIRKRLLDYDKVLDAQRQTIYDQRRQVLVTEDIDSIIVKMIDDAVDDALELADEVDYNERTLFVVDRFRRMLTPGAIVKMLKLEEDDLVAALDEELEERYNFIKNAFTSVEVLNARERSILLDVVDDLWQTHLDDLDQLKTGISLVSYAKMDPLVEYRRISSQMFDEMSRNIRLKTVEALLMTGSSR